MRKPGIIAVTILLGFLCITGGAGAQPVAPTAPGPATEWQFSVTPYAWLPGVNGTLSTPLPRVGDSSFDLDRGSVVSDLDAVPLMIAGEARYQRFSVVGDFFYTALRQDIATPRGLLFDDGHARITTSVGTLLGLFRLVEVPGQSFDLGAGTRIWGIGTKVSLNPGLAGEGVIRKSSQAWADPIFALRYAASFTPRLGVTVYGDVGGFDAGSRLTWQAMGSIDYAVTEGTVLRAGWRYLYVDRTRGQFGVDVGFNGPFFAATFRF